MRDVAFVKKPEAWAISINKITPIDFVREVFFITNYAKWNA